MFIIYLGAKQWVGNQYAQNNPVGYQAENLLNVGNFSNVHNLLGRYAVGGKSKSSE